MVVLSCIRLKTRSAKYPTKSLNKNIRIFSRNILEELSIYFCYAIKSYAIKNVL